MESGLPLMEYPLSTVVIIIILFLIVLRQSPLHG